MKSTHVVRDLKIGLWSAIISFTATVIGGMCLILTESPALSFAVLIACIAFGVRRLIDYILKQYGIST